MSIYTSNRWTILKNTRWLQNIDQTMLERIKREGFEGLPLLLGHPQLAGV